MVREEFEFLGNIRFVIDWFPQGVNDKVSLVV
jgi:hypothetical protein